jgi:hypothetical protein
MKNALSMRLLQFLSALCLLSVIPAKAAQSGDFTYTATATDVSITGYTGTGGVVTIPDTINSLPVTSIGIGAFANKTGLHSVSIPSSVTSIGNQAFVNCTALTSVSIPSSVTSIGDNAFSNCTGLTKITIPSSVTSIGSGMFTGCKILNAITVAPDNSNFSSVSGVLFNKSQTAIIEYPANRPGTAYTIPVSVTSIGDSAFYFCTRLTSVSIPDSVISIGEAAFYSCTGLTKITIPSSVTSIRNNAFSSCSGLASVSIPSSVNSIGVNAFAWCPSLTSVSIPDSVISIGEAAFYSCTGLTSVSIPSSVTSIGNQAFYSCSKLQAVFFAGNPPAVGTQGFSSGTIYYSFEATNWGASFAGRPTALMLNPIIMSQPVSLSSNQGTTAILSIVAMGSNSLSYQWVKNGVDISGATGATLELGNVQATDAGSYKVRVGSEWGSVTSNAADLSVVVLIAPPSIIGQPSSIIANPGESAVFSVTATGSNLGYQWRRNGVIVAGATSPSLSFSAIQPVHVGTYNVAIANPSGTITSASVSLTLNAVYSQAQYDVIAQAAQADIISSPNSYGLYSLSQMQALNVGAPLLAKDPVSGKFKLTIGVEKSNNLVNFLPMPIAAESATINAQGKMEFQFTAPDSAAFYRLETH